MLLQFGYHYRTVLDLSGISSRVPGKLRASLLLYCFTGAAGSTGAGDAGSALIGQGDVVHVNCANLPSVGQRHRSVDQADVRECLREVAEVGASRGVDLLGVEAEGGRAAEHAIEEALGLLFAIGQDERIDQPEGA